jgi:hypothetical protein
MFARIFLLSFLVALTLHLGMWERPLCRDGGEAYGIVLSSSATTSLPNECELVAVEKEAALHKAVIRPAHRRMKRADIWTRILIVTYADQKVRHALCVYQPHWQICAYDASGTYELFTGSHDAQAIARALGQRTSRPIIDGVFLK